MTHHSLCGNKKFVVAKLHISFRCDRLTIEMAETVSRNEPWSLLLVKLDGMGKHSTKLPHLVLRAKHISDVSRSPYELFASQFARHTTSKEYLRHNYPSVSLSLSVYDPESVLLTNTVKPSFIKVLKCYSALTTSFVPVLFQTILCSPTLCSGVYSMGTKEGHPHMSVISCTLSQK